MDDKTQSVITDLSLDEAVCTPTVMFTASGDISPTPTSSSYRLDRISFIRPSKSL